MARTFPERFWNPNGMPIRITTKLVHGKASLRWSSTSCRRVFTPKTRSRRRCRLKSL